MIATAFPAVALTPTPDASSSPKPSVSVSSPIPTQSPVGNGGLTSHLVAFPPFVGPEGKLSISLTVKNNGARPASGLRVALSIHEGVKTRSQLERTFSGKLGAVIGSDTLPVEGTLDAGETRTIEVEKALSDIAFFRSTPEDRAYPVRITMRSDRSISAPIDTHMIFFAEQQENPLLVGLVLPMDSPSIYGLGRAPSNVSSDALEKAVNGGRLSKLFDTLDANPEIPLTISPSGILVDMLSDMSNGFIRNGRRIGAEDAPALRAAAALQRIAAIATRPSTRILPMPYSTAFLPGFVRADLTNVAQAQVVSGREAVSGEKSVLKLPELEGWLFPAGGALDERTLSALQLTKIDHALLSPLTLRQKPGPLTRSASVTIRTRSGSKVAGLVLDPGLTERLRTASTNEPAVSRQRFLAETATIMLERPGTQRAVVAVAPLDWNVPTGYLDGLLKAIGDSPWTKPVALDGIPANETVALSVDLAPSDDVNKLTPFTPGADYFSSISQARKAIDRYGDLYPPDVQISRLEHRLLIAESSQWWTSASSVRVGETFAKAIPETVQREFAKIDAPARQTITLTSHTGQIPLSVTSRLDYPVYVVLKLDSDKLRFPDGNRIKIDRLQAPSKTVTVRTITQATGTFVLNVSVETSNETRIAASRLTVRSTAYNIVGLAITGGAAAFLVAWWLASIARRRLPS